MFGLGHSTETRGPLFDGSARRVIDAFLDEAKEEVADEGVNDVLSVLGSKLQNPTGYYESQIATDRQRDDYAVTDSGVIYGPWLEGTSSRNQTTRFKGYSTFRRTTQTLQGKAPDIAERVLPRYLNRLS